MDVAVVAAVRKQFPDIDLTVDGNSAYRLEDAPLLKKLDDFCLSYIEQPLPWNDIYQHSLLQPQLKTAICLDECIHGLRDADAAIALGACKVINIKLGGLVAIRLPGAFSHIARRGVSPCGAVECLSPALDVLITSLCRRYPALSIQVTSQPASDTGSRTSSSPRSK